MFPQLLMTLQDRLAQITNVDPVTLVGALVGGIFALIVGRLFFRSTYSFLLFITLFVLAGGSAGIPWLRGYCKGALRWVMLFLLAAVGLLPSGHRPRSRHGGGVILAVFAFVGFTFFSCFYSIWRGYSFPRAISFAVVAVAAYVGVFKYAADQRGLRDLMDALYKLAFVIVGLSFLLIVRPMQSVGVRAAGFFTNPNSLGIYCGMLLPLVIFRYWEKKRNGERRRLVTLGLALALAFLIFMSGSRGAFIGSVLACGFLIMILYGGGAAIGVVMVGVIGVLAVIASPALRERVQEKTAHLVRAERLATLTHRTELWAKAKPYIIEKPFFGSGFGVSRWIFYADVMDLSDLNPEELYYTTLHSMHIQILVDLGLIGLVFLWLLMFYVPLQGVRLLIQKDSTTERALAAAFCAGVSVALLDTFVHGWLYSAGSALCLLFHVMFAMFLRALCQWDVPPEEAEEAHEEEAPETSDEPKYAAAV